MATNLTGQTISTTYEKLLKRQDSYSATGNRIEIQNDSAVSLDTALYLDVVNQRVGIGTTSPEATLHVKGNEQLILEDDAGSASAGQAWRLNTDSAGQLNYTYSATCDMAGDGSVNVVFAEDGRVGIGTASPSVPLHIAMDDGTPSVASNVGLLVHNCSASGDHASIQIASGAGGNSTVLFSDTADNNIGRIQYVHADNSMDFYTADTQQMTILTSGNVGIGTSAPVNTLHVSHNATTNDNGILIVNEQTTITDGELLGAIGFDSSDNSVADIPDSTLKASCFMAAYAAEDHSSGDKGGDLTFGCSLINENKDVLSTRHMTILSDGNVGIGTTAPDAHLHVYGGDGTTASNLGTMILGKGNGNATGEEGIILTYDEDDDNMFHIKWNNEGSIATRMTIDSAGNVGIGTDSPGYPLSVKTADSGTVTNAVMQGGSGVIQFHKDAAISKGAAVGLALPGVTAGNDFSISTYSGSAWSERLTILEASGNVGIGTTSPDRLFQVSQAGSGDTTILSIEAKIDGESRLEFSESDTPDYDGGMIAYFHASHSTTAYRDMMMFRTADNVRMAIDSSGNVGIGHTTPQSDNSTAQFLHIGDSGDASAGLVLEDNDNQWEILTNNNLYFLDGTDTRLFIAHTTGNVGIGTTIPSSTLEVRGENSSSTTTIAGAMNNGIKLNIGSGVINNHLAPALSWYSVDANLDADGTEDSIGAITMQAAETFDGSNSSGADMRFYTHKIDTDGGLGVKMSILSSGNVGIGVTDPDSQLEVKSVTGADCHVDINCTDSDDATSDTILKFSEAGTTKWYFYNDGSDSDKFKLVDAGGTVRDHMVQSTNGWVGSSDERLKENIEPIDNVLDKLKDIRCITYNWNYVTDEAKKITHLGLIAQEVYEAFPDMNDIVQGHSDDFQITSAATDEDGTISKPAQIDGAMSVGYSRLTVILLKAVQELTAKVTALENNNNQGENSNVEQEQEQSESDTGDNGDSSGESSSESTGEDSGGVEGSSGDSSDSSESSSGEGELSPDNEDESSGGSGSDSSNDSEGGSGEDDSGGNTPEGDPSGEWTKDQLKAYMDANSIGYNSGDTKDDLLSKINNANSGEES